MKQQINPTYTLCKRYIRVRTQEPTSHVTKIVNAITGRRLLFVYHPTYKNIFLYTLIVLFWSISSTQLYDTFCFSLKSIIIFGCLKYKYKFSQVRQINQSLVGIITSSYRTRLSLYDVKKILKKFKLIKLL